jgi:16S rRNA (uracil1498-N3)-methyltransferase
MRFLYNPSASSELLEITDENFKYLSKVRRIQNGQSVTLKNFKDSYDYEYEVTQITKKSIHLRLLSKELSTQRLKPLHIGWCVVDFKTVEKTLPFLNELGVGKITFIYCKKSQRNFKPNFERMQKILINSCQQCGREDLMELSTVNSLKEFTKLHPNAYMCNFGGQTLTSQQIDTIIIGPEGGFSECESALDIPKIGFDTPLILRSETAVTAVASKILV